MEAGHATPDMTGIKYSTRFSGRALSKNVGEASTSKDQSHLPNIIKEHEPPRSSGQYGIYIVPAVTKSSSVKIYKERYAILRLQNKDELEAILPSLLAAAFFEEQSRVTDSIMELLAGPREAINGTQTTDRLKSSKKGKESADNMRAVPYAPRYRITFSLMNADPADIKLSWAMEETIAAYLQPLLHQLSTLSNFTVESQTQHYATLTLTPQKVRDSKNETYYALTPKSLPIFVNSAEWNLASAVTSDPSLDFLVYVPSAQNYPLKVLDSNGAPTESNAFLIPRWGGVVIDNKRPTGDRKDHRYSVPELRVFMEIFVEQLRGLLGVSSLFNKAPHFDIPVTIEVENSPSTGITDWEMDKLIRQRTAQNIIGATTTLKSLAALTQQIGNMVVLDQIQVEVQEALENLSSACHFLDASSPIEAFERAKQALIGSEKAFFDPTMVAMLYFPDEHKYAIYMPLFVPVSVPLILTLLKEIKARRKDRQDVSPAEKKKSE